MGSTSIPLMPETHFLSNLKIERGVYTDLVVVSMRKRRENLFCLTELQLISTERFVSTFLVDTETLDELVSSIMQRIGLDHDNDKIQLLVRS